MIVSFQHYDNDDCDDSKYDSDDSHCVVVAYFFCAVCTDRSHVDRVFSRLFFSLNLFENKREINVRRIS